MTILFTAHEISKSFRSRALFSELSLTIESNERIGLIGPNGAGKSTLLKIIANKLEADAGKLSMDRGLRIGYLEQVPVFANDATVLSTILEGVLDPEDWSQIANAHELISRFDLDQFGEDAKIDNLSGGWKKRVALARELIKDPNLLLLDEPTNHLDVEGIYWLEQFLARASFAVLTITHDRVFLQNVVNRIIEIDRRHSGGLLSVKGDYLTYLQLREEMIGAQENRETVLKNTLRRETEWLRRGPKARTTKQQARIDRAADLKNEVADLEDRNQNKIATFEFQDPGRSPKRLISAEKISKSYEDREIFTNLELAILSKSRLGIIGANGIGKSTLIRVLIGQEPPTTGEISVSEKLSVAYFDQAREELDPQATVAETISPEGDHVEYRGRSVHIRSYLDRFLFTQEQMDMPIGSLSGGEQSRVLVARLMLTNANLIVLDEPTNDLDVATLNVLEDCLRDFPGAVILVTHDRYFLDRVTDQLIAFPPIGLKPELQMFADLAQWEEWYRPLRKKAKKALLGGPVNAGSRSGEADGAGGRVEVEKPKKKKRLSYMEEREFKGIEAKIALAEQQLQELEMQSTAPDIVTNAIMLSEIVESMAKAQAEVERLYARWAELEERSD